ncbi:hypothetical protein ACUOIV_28265, partial [Escherichia coli]
HEINKVETDALEIILEDFKKAQGAAEPDIRSVEDHVFAPTAIKEEKGQRVPKGAEKVMMVDAALHAIDEILDEYPEAILYGQDVGGRLGGVFREAATWQKNMVRTECLIQPFKRL